MNRLIIRSLVTASLLLVLLSVPSIASADSILWTLSGVSFEGIDQTTGLPSGVTGGTATGFFMYDLATNTYSDIHITTTTGSGLGGSTYTTLSAGPFQDSPTSLWLGASSGNLMGTPLFALFFTQPGLGNSGGLTNSLLTGIDMCGLEGSCDNTAGNTGCDSSTPFRFVTGGEVTSSTVVATPEPSSLSLLGVALGALLAGVAIRKTQA